MSWLQQKKRGLHFTLNDHDNYNFDIKVKCYGFMSFVNNVIECRWVIYFVLKLKRKRKIYSISTFILYYSLKFLFFLLQLNN